MSRCLKASLAVLVGFAVPLTVGAAVTENEALSDADDAVALTAPTIESERIDSVDQGRGVELAVAEEPNAGADGQEQGVESATACCWIFYFGRWWCVPCG